MANLRDLITGALSDYECTFTRTGNVNGVDDDPFPLVDQLTPPGQSSVALGRQELELLADHIAGALLDAGVTLGVLAVSSQTKPPADADGGKPE